MMCIENMRNWSSSVFGLYNDSEYEMKNSWSLLKFSQKFGKIKINTTSFISGLTPTP